LAKRDYYEVLSLNRGASADEVKKAYRKAALQFHPDKNPGNKESEELFKEATEAYQVLSDPERRAKYDKFGHAAFEQGAGFQGFGDFSGFEDVFGDIFSSFFGGTSQGRSSSRAGRDLRYDLAVEFEEAVFGCSKEIEFQRRSNCEDCSGSGATPGSKPEACKQCGGSGQVRMQQGFFTIARTCSICQGTGEFIANPCRGCDGSGLKAKSVKVQVKIPAGIDAGQRLKLRGEGDGGPLGGPAGDLYVLINIKEHPIFERDESEIICTMPISYPSAVLGADINVPTLDGSVSMKIPSGTESGKIFRLRGKGVPILGTNRRGDQHVRIVVNVPKKVSERHRQALETLKEFEQDGQGMAEAKSFFEKMRDMFAGT
jgi:molecular chaperone DnaJ